MYFSQLYIGMMTEIAGSFVANRITPRGSFQFFELHLQIADCFFELIFQARYGTFVLLEYVILIIDEIEEIRDQCGVSAHFFMELALDKFFNDLRRIFCARPDRLI